MNQNYNMCKGILFFLWAVLFPTATKDLLGGEKWSVPFNIAISKLVRWGRLPVSLQGGIGYWAKSPDYGPEGYRFRLQANFVLPKKNKPMRWLHETITG